MHNFMRTENFCRKSRLAATTAIMFAMTMAGYAHAAGPFDTSDPAYKARAADMVARGKIQKECLPSAAPAPDAKYVPIAAPSDELVAAASKEGQLILNAALSDKTSIDSVEAAFEMRYPNVKMTVAVGSSQSMEERFLADHAAGNQSVDAEISTKITWVEKALKEKALQPLDTTIPGFFDKWPGKPWRWETKFGSSAPFIFRPVGIGYNTDLVKGNMIPKQYQDLARPEFKGQLIGLDPAQSVTYARVWKVILDVVGEETFKKIGENMIKNPIYNDVQPAAQALGAGGGMLLYQMGGNVGNTMRLSGAPIAEVYPDTLTGSQYGFGVATKAPHPNAAKLFAHWLYSAEGQWVGSCAAFSRSVAYPGNANATLVPIDDMSKDEIAKLRKLLGL